MSSPPSKPKPKKGSRSASTGRPGNKHAKGHGEGRPQSYKPEFAKRAYAFILLKGYETTDAEIALFLNVTLRTIDGWKRRHQDFRVALVRGREADQGVAVSMYRRANGYKHKSEEIFFNKDGLCVLCTERIAEGKKPDKGCYICGGAVKGTVTRVPTVKKYPPDSKIGLAILRRQEKSWQQTRAIEFSGPDGRPMEVNLDSIDVEDLSPETLEMIAKDIKERVRKKREDRE